MSVCIRGHSSITSSKRWVGGVRKWQFVMIYSTVNHQEFPFFDPTHPPPWWRNTWMPPKDIPYFFTKVAWDKRYFFRLKTVFFRTSSFDYRVNGLSPLLLPLVSLPTVENFKNHHHQQQQYKKKYNFTIVGGTLFRGKKLLKDRLCTLFFMS